MGSVIDRGHVKDASIGWVGAIALAAVAFVVSAVGCVYFVGAAYWNAVDQSSFSGTALFLGLLAVPPTVAVVVNRRTRDRSRWWLVFVTSLALIAAWSTAMFAILVLSYGYLATR